MTDMPEKEEVELRLALDLIGEAAQPDAAPLERTVHPVRRLRRKAVVGVIVAAAVAALGVGLALDGPAPSAKGKEEAKASTAVWIACSQFMVVGDVVSVEEDDGDRLAVVLSVQEWLKPSHGPKTADMIVADPATLGGKRWKIGEQVLITVDDDSKYSHTYRGDQIKRVSEKIKRALPKAATTECPPPGDARGDT